jgi:hypothetical protein
LVLPLTLMAIIIARWCRLASVLPHCQVCACSMKK